MQLQLQAQLDQGPNAMPLGLRYRCRIDDYCNAHRATDCVTLYSSTAGAALSTIATLEDTASRRHLRGLIRAFFSKIDSCRKVQASCETVLPTTLSSTNGRATTALHLTSSCC